MISIKLKFPKKNNQDVVCHMIRATRNESGAVLIMAMLLMVVIVLLVSGVVRMTTSDSSRVANYESTRRAFNIAEAGVDAAKAYIRTQNFDKFLGGLDGDPATTTDNGLIHDGVDTDTSAAIAYTLYGTAVTYQGNKYSEVDYDGGTYKIRVFDNQDETTDDPTVDVDNILIVESVGTIGTLGDDVQETITAAIRKYNYDGEFPSAVTMVGPSYTLIAGGDIHIDGGNKIVSGTPNGVAWDMKGYGVPGSGLATKPDPDPDCPAKNALTTEASYDGTEETWNGSSEDGFRGITNSHLTDSIADIGYDQTQFKIGAAEDMREQLIPHCDNCYEALPLPTTDVNQFASTVVLGTMADPEITYVNGNARFAAGARGAGVLMVDGDMDIVGDLNWAGIILIGGCGTCTGELIGVGSARVYGAMVVGNGFDGDGNFSGSADIYYSCDGISVAKNAFGNSFKDIGWNQSSN